MRTTLLFCTAILVTPILTGSADVTRRWQRTATNASTGSFGDAITLTWGFVADGTSIVGGAGEPTSDSNLISFLDGLHGAGPGGTDLTQRPWFSSFESAYNRWGEVSGLTFQYEPNDTGAQISNTTILPRGELGVVADMRISGHSIDGQIGSNTLAYNYFPDHGDMVIDTDNTAFFGNAANDLRGLRNVVAHEAGHGLGMDHRESSNTSFLMEPFINNSFDGPQFDDIWSIQRGYGDVHEKGLGNDVLANATEIGTLAAGQQVVIGADAVDARVEPGETDFIGIDGTSDTDFLTFTLSQAGMLDLVLDPMGPTYSRGPQDGSQSQFDASAQSDLMFELFAADGTSLGLASAAGAGIAESLLGLNLLAGQYFVQVSTAAGAADQNQLYRLTGSLTAVPEPSGLAALLFASGACLRRRRRS